MIHGFKGFDKDLKCRGFQFAPGGEYEEADAAACRRGFHFCENPLDVFNYYPPADSRYAKVVGDGKTDKDNDDSKVACSKLRVGVEIGLNGLISAGVKFVLDKVDWSSKKESNTGDQSAATNTGDQSAATNTGYQSAATNTGDQSAATNTGYQSAATNTGDQSAATVEGKESVAIAIGYESKARGALGCWIVLAEWEELKYEYHVKDVQSVKVDGEKIKADTFYRLVNGEFVEAD
ncbi:DUF7666 domain-containing protein [Desulfosporosinus hippei]|uniref:DUF7666 domain-containing protein n=1 Tax=Desulfosporosinus hippei DSM 8344 TaxID=1121419 RepID=A0A1G7ULV8_9FIRM|nr:hypothetical protein [Desulfosporosinus hippei]SDG48483.1 hypothetical protein SAMN05443529_103183 [Desulfosporosinus hippei DSM 8344]